MFARQWASDLLQWNCQVCCEDSLQQTDDGPELFARKHARRKSDEKLL